MYDFQTCLNLFRFNMIWIVTIHVILKHVWTCWNMSKLVQIQHDMNCYNSYDSQTCLNLFRINMIRIDTILKHVKTWNQNMMKYSNIWANGTKNVWRQSDSLDRCEQVERSKMTSLTPSIYEVIHLKVFFKNFAQNFSPSSRF